MNFKIVADSSSDVLCLQHVPFASAPLTIVAGERTYVDNAELNVAGMVADLKAHKGKTSTACPGIEDWLNAFGDAEHIICFTITSGLSGTYNSARLAAQEYEELHPGRRVFVMDTLSTGPEIRLLLEKTDALIHAGLDFDQVVENITAYGQHTHLLYALASLHNLVSNGRVSPAVGALIGLLGIRVVGCASAKGDLEILGKARGEKKTLTVILSAMKERLFGGGRVHIAHCNNESGANALKELLLAHWPGVNVSIAPARALCSYYAEEGGLLIGFEGR